MTAASPTRPPRSLQTTRTAGNFPHGSRETPATSASSMEADRSEKAQCLKSDMHVVGESDRSIVPGKPANNGACRCLRSRRREAKLADLKAKLSWKRRADLATVGAWLQGVLRGWCQYYAVPGNSPRLQQFRDAIQKLWLRALRRRSQRGRRLTWAMFSKRSKRWLPTPKILHPNPNVRFAGQHPR